MARLGFTLTEVMVSLFILVAGMVSASVFFGSMSRAARFTDSAIAATALAQQRIEELLEQTYAGMASGSDTTNVYSRTWTVQFTNNAATITVTVGWDEIGGHHRTMTLSTIRAP
jgi:prepilin-type N-terminal cleavage/methylation domain-containing protein